jgi:hypothetical protein
MRLIRKRFLKNSVFLVLQGRQLLLLSPNNSTYVFTKINEQEFKLAKDSQKMPHPKCNPKQKGKVVGEKWLIESMQHSREFHNASIEVPEVVAEFTVDKKCYKNIREKAIL